MPVRWQSLEDESLTGVIVSRVPYATPATELGTSEGDAGLGPGHGVSPVLASVGSREAGGFKGGLT